jgi:TRAP-type mannitol/chloroaromatic compound transport system permease small subunit
VLFQQALPKVRPASTAAPGKAPTPMDLLLRLARLIDGLNDRFGGIAKYAVILSCFISAGNAIIRFGFNTSSNAWLEIQWYLFAACVMLGASQVLRLNEHVRVDLFYGRLGGHGKVYVDLFGLIVFLLPVMTAMLYLSIPLFLQMYRTGEMSSNAGGLVRWPAMLMLPLGFTMVLLQGISEIIKRIAWLMHRIEMDIHYERPLQ